MNLLKLLNASNFRIYNIEIAKRLGNIKAAVLLHDLIDQYEYFKSSGKLVKYKKYNGSWFFYTVDKCKERTMLTKKDQITAIKILEEHNIFEKKIIGIPAKRHFQINEDGLIKFLNFKLKDNECEKETDVHIHQNGTDSCSQSDQLDDAFGDNQYTSPNKSPNYNSFAEDSPNQSENNNTTSKKDKKNKTKAISFNKESGEFENIPDDLISSLKNEFILVDLDFEFEKMCEWLSSHQGKKNYKTFIRNWFAKSQQAAEYNKNNKQSRRSGPKQEWVKTSDYVKENKSENTEEEFVNFSEAL